MTDSLRELLLSIVPDDGSAVGNLALAAAMREIVPDLSDETYQRIRDGLIAEGALAIEMGATVGDMAATIHAHPTLPEAMMEAAEAVHSMAVHIFQKPTSRS